MRAAKLDPAVWVVIGLLGVAVISVLMVLATRSCAQAMRDAFSSTAEESASHETKQWADKAVRLKPEEYAAFAKKARSIGLGIGVHLGLDMEQVESILGAADSAARAMGGAYEYTYLFFADATGPGPKERHKGGFFAVVGSASLTLTIVGEKVTGVSFFATPIKGEDKARWPFLTLNGRPLMRCTKDDLAALLGEPTESTRRTATWRFVPASPAEEAALPAEIDSGSPGGGVAEGEPPAESSAADAGGTLKPSQIPPPPASAPGPTGGILVEAVINTDTGFLYSLELRER